MRMRATVHTLKFMSFHRMSLNLCPELETLMIRAPGAAF
jgi:hypothetical protein